MEDAPGGWSLTVQSSRPTAIDVELCPPRRSISSSTSLPAPTRGASASGVPQLIQDESSNISFARSVLDQHGHHPCASPIVIGADVHLGKASAGGYTEVTASASKASTDLAAFREELRQFELERDAGLKTVSPVAHDLVAAAPEKFVARSETLLASSITSPSASAFPGMATTSSMYSSVAAKYCETERTARAPLRSPQDSSHQELRSAQSLPSSMSVVLPTITDAVSRSVSRDLPFSQEQASREIEDRKKERLAPVESGKSVAAMFKEEFQQLSLEPVISLQTSCRAWKDCDSALGTPLSNAGPMPTLADKFECSPAKRRQVCEAIDTLHDHHASGISSALSETLDIAGCISDRVSYHTVAPEEDASSYSTQLLRPSGVGLAPPLGQGRLEADYRTSQFRFDIGSSSVGEQRPTSSRVDVPKASISSEQSNPREVDASEALFTTHALSMHSAGLQQLDFISSGQDVIDKSSCMKRGSTGSAPDVSTGCPAHGSDASARVAQQDSREIEAQLVQTSQERDGLAKALKRAEDHEAQVTEQIQKAAAVELALRSELQEARQATMQAEARAESYRADCDAEKLALAQAEARAESFRAEGDAVKLVLQELVAAERSRDLASALESDCSQLGGSSLTALAAEVVAICETRREELHDVEGRLEAMKHAATEGSHVRAVRDVLAIGTKLWRLQQAQRSLAPSNNGLKTSSGNGKSNSRPLYSLPSARRVGDDVAAHLLTEMSQALRDIEEGLHIQP